MKFEKFLDSIIPLALVFILTILLFPMPGWFLDICLSLNIIVSFVILFVSLYVEKPIQFSVYPALLLITTVFRLALNVATTRRILLNGHEGLDTAGQLIMAFGQFLIQGNFVVGLIIFLIISIINLKVITKGAGRIAEVAARFTLDALPGKQLSIDSDLSAGIITEQEARERRKQLAREAEFYGAMDGAAKFVSGEALTGIFIMVLNILGGFSIGYFQHAMSFGEAAKTFTILTVGDGLLSQIPAIIMSVSAGLIVSRAASGEQFSFEILSQLGKTIWPLAFAGVASILLGLLPGLPLGPFLFGGIIAFFLALMKVRGEKLKERLKSKREQEKEVSQDLKKTLTTDDLIQLMDSPSIKVQLGSMTGQIIGTERIKEINKKIRSSLASNYGFICPSIHVTDTPGTFRFGKEPFKILIKGSLVVETTIDTMKSLALKPSDDLPPLDAEPALDPIYNVEGYWIEKNKIKDAAQLGYHISEPAAIYHTTLTEVITYHMYELLRRQDVHNVISKIQKEFPKLVDDLIPQHLSLAQLHQILSALLYEFVSIKDMHTILEALGEAAPFNKNIDYLVEYVRKRIIKFSLYSKFERGTFLRLLNLDGQVEQLLRDAILEKEEGRIVALNPRVGMSLLSKIEQFYYQEVKAMSYLVILVSPDIRLPFAKFILPKFRRTLVITADDIPYGFKVKSIGIISLDDASESVKAQTERAYAV
ncbi:MAG: flagellar biosynthesis protein FlhA [Deltaproteobacteria bacterium]|nr:flagellar biosynthesis protein FlhA [Deltaproteobacteria bacterium]MCX7953280.1 flagellar biosynthesis protein FlhA [Deltaproteobacteria bacterium]